MPHFHIHIQVNQLFIPSCKALNALSPAGDIFILCLRSYARCEKTDGSLSNHPPDVLETGRSSSSFAQNYGQRYLSASCYLISVHNKMVKMSFATSIISTNMISSFLQSQLLGKSIKNYSVNNYCNNSLAHLLFSPAF